MKYLAILCGLALGSCGAFAVYKTVHVEVITAANHLMLQPHEPPREDR